MLSHLIDYIDSNHLEEWFHTFKIWTNRFRLSWLGSGLVIVECCQQFKRYYNKHCVKQAPDSKMPSEVLS
jgi:hypothetical protein